MFVHVEGRIDETPRAGRPADPFAPRARRIAATLIEHPDRTFTQRELAHASSLDEGRTSRVVRDLETNGYVERVDRGVRLIRRERLIDAYRDSLPFAKEAVLRGSVVARSSEAVVRTMRELFVDEGIGYAATGLLAAHAHLGRPAPKRATFYVERIPGSGAATLAGLAFGEGRPNVELVVPRDTRVFEAARDLRGLRCAPSLDVYADLASFADADQRLVAELRALI